MATIPVPVHFDGHNINIITEDSPSTRKCWSKSGNFKRKMQQPKIPQCARNEVYIQNLSMPIKSPSNKENRDTVDRDQITPEPQHTPERPKTRRVFHPVSPGSSENKTPPLSEQGQTDNPLSPPHKYNPLAASFTPLAASVSSETALKPIAPQRVQQNHNRSNGGYPMRNANANGNAKANQNQNGRPAPMCPRVPRNHGQNGHNPAFGRGVNPNAMRRGGPAVTNEQLIKMGFDPNEFGSHDDVGFEDERGGKGDRQNLYKTELCREWSASGWCYYNKRCSFAHGLHELRPVFRSKKWRTKRCRNWHTTGYCPYEHRCQFLHDQSPPRRMQDYANGVVATPSASGMANVVEAPKQQPMYFHYKVDCDRKAPAQPKANDDEDQKVPTTTRGEAANVYDDDEKDVRAMNGDGDGNTAQATFRRVMMSKVTERDRNAKDKTKYPDHPKYPELNLAPRQRKVHEQRQREMQKGAAQKQKREHKLKDTVITPFNPIVHPPIPAFNAMSMNMAPQMAMNVAAHPPQPPSMVTPMSVASAQQSSMFVPPLPPSIDPNAYLTLTPSPDALGDGPDENVAHLRIEQLELKLSEQQQKLQAMHQKVREAAVRGQAHHEEATHTISGVPHTISVGPSLSRRSESYSQSPDFAECASIGEDLLHSFLPNDPLINVEKQKEKEKEREREREKERERAKEKTKGAHAEIGTVSVNSKRKKMSGTTGSWKKAGAEAEKKKKRQDPPLLPPLLQLQLSQNSVVNSAVNAAMTMTTPTAAAATAAMNATKLVPMTPTLANAKVSPDNVKSSPTMSEQQRPTTTHTFHHHYMPAVPTVPMPSMYAQQAHAHAHAYAAAHVNHGAYPVPMAATAGMGGAAAPYAMSGVSGMAPLGSMPLTPMSGMALPPFGGALPAMPVTPLAMGGQGVAVQPMMQYPHAPYPASMASHGSSDMAWQFASRHY